ncbi:calpain family cysteine protease [Nitzschia inconspicua]|uniref:Calpain family cysteine protease n=1 Tax=Nitzschia inconspicua TaxID=303405 RepID=A0A9K3KMA5_9STRA|nr:calpain family cysteine protease [Nitzschia inconspicua]
MDLLDEVFQVLESAKQLEKRGNRIEAATKYYESCYLMRQVLHHTPQNEQSMPTRNLLEEKIEYYTQAAQNLYFDDRSTTPHTITTNPRAPSLDDISVLTNPPIHDHPMTPPPPPSPATYESPRFTQPSIVNRKASQANAKLSRAIDLDEQRKPQEAIDNYMNAAELYLEAIRLSEASSSSSSSSSNSLSAVLKRRLEKALDRVERLKHPNAPNRILLNGQNRAGDARVCHPGSSLSKEEIAVLKQSSLISSGVFLPWSEDEAQALSQEVLAKSSTCKGKLLQAVKSAWKDPDGDLKLSDKQKKRFYKWMRPHEIANQRQSLGVKQRPPVMVDSINPYTIRQEYVTDCSFIASLCICALFEKRFQKRLVTSIIYPQDNNGIPIYNPEGKYIVKLWLNGVARQVVVDDRLPCDKHSNLLCSHTTGDKHQLELWVAIIEKAYMKLCGGYDFPGSNSGVDMFSLNGYIPERIFFPQNGKKVRDFETPPDRAWERLYSANSFGDCLITVSTTRDISDQEAESLGLVTGHAYAVLDVFQSTSGVKLLQLKNPWQRRSWKGKYSPLDVASWRGCLKKEVGYDPIEAAKQDDGIFYIAWEDVLLYFRNLQLSWNPRLFSYRTTTHGVWPVSQGPQNDTFNVGENPQFVLQMSDDAVARKPTVWVLLSRHVNKQEQEGEEVNDFLTVHLVRNSDKKERIWYPHGPNTLVNGAYTNNPHVLLRYDLSGPDDKFVSLVLSQHEKSHDLAYTLSCFCTERFTLGKPPEILPYSMSAHGYWTGRNSGGPVGSKGFFNNPMYAVTVKEECAIQLRCSGTKTNAVNVMLASLQGKQPKNLQRYRELANSNGMPILDSGNYRHGFTVTDTKIVRPATYVLIVSTYEEGQSGSFDVAIASAEKIVEIESVPFLDQ